MNYRIILIVFISFFLTALLAGAADTDSGDTNGNQAVKGKQLVKQGNCGFCHTPLIETKEGAVPAPGKTLSGFPSGMELPELPEADVDSKEWLEFLASLPNTVWAGPWGLSFASNITPDPGTGIGKWTEDIFIETMRSGKHIDLKRNISPPMPWQDYGKLSDEELSAIFAYLMTLKPVVNPVPKPIPIKQKEPNK